MKGRAYKIPRNDKYDEYQTSLASMVYKFVDKKTRSAVNVIEKLSEELDKLVIKEFKRKYLGRRFLSRIKMLNIYYLWYMFSLRMHGLNL